MFRRKKAIYGNFPEFLSKKLSTATEDFDESPMSWWDRPLHFQKKPPTVTVAPSRSGVSAPYNVKTKGSSGVNVVGYRTSGFRRRIKRKKRFIPYSMPEVKRLDVDISKTVAIAGNAYQSELLNPLVRGDTVNDRDGDKVRALSLQMKVQIASTSNTALCKTMIVWDNDSRGVAALWTYLHVTANTIALREPDYFGQFRVLYDEVIQLDAELQEYAYKEVYIDLQKVLGAKGAISNYCLGNAGTVADIKSGALWLLVNATANDATVTWTGVTRFRFNDF